MQDNFCRKGLVFIILVLFVGASITPTLVIGDQPPEEEWNKTLCMEEKEEANDYIIERIDNLTNQIEDGWIPCLLEDIGMSNQTHVYIRRVGSHLEIGVAQVNFIR